MTAAEIAATAAARIDAETEGGYRPSIEEVLVEIAAETGSPIPDTERGWNMLVRKTMALLVIKA